MKDPTFRNIEWNLTGHGSESVRSWDAVIIAVLMDIRRELRSLNSTLNCHRFQGIPNALDLIEKNTRKPRRRKKRKS